MSVTLNCYKHNLTYGEFEKCPSCEMEKALRGLMFAADDRDACPLCKGTGKAIHVEEDE
jgi:excinuclease UvrABC ATPase subunit